MGAGMGSPALSFQRIDMGLRYGRVAEIDARESHDDSLGAGSKAAEFRLEINPCRYCETKRLENPALPTKKRGEDNV